MHLCLSVALRGVDFREEYANISELRSIVPSSVNLMALTATVTTTTRRSIMDTLCMDQDTFVIENIPNKKNIFYKVLLKSKDFSTILLPIVQQVREHGINTPKTIIFCRTYKELTKVSTYLMDQLFSNNLFYACIPGKVETPICEIYSSATDETVKSDILPAFTAPDGYVRIVVATIAFGLGLDAPDVKQIIHWGSSDSVEAYIQETGRAGRDGDNATATLYYSKSDISKSSTISDGMKMYCSNVHLCRRKLLMKAFTHEDIECPTPLHACCDICTVNCKCDICGQSVLLRVEELASFCEDDVEVESSKSLPLQKQRDVKSALTNYRDRLCKVKGSDVPQLFGKEIMSGIPTSLIINIAKNCADVNCSSDLCNLGGMSKQQACEMFDIIKKIIA